MYILTPTPNSLIALDLTQEGYIKWEFQPEMPGLAQATACCGAQSRGLTYAEGKIFFNTLDGQLFAVDAERSEEHTSELQSRGHLVCRLLLEKKKFMQDPAYSG